MCRRCDVLGPVHDSNLTTINDVHEDNWMAVCMALGCVHEQSMGAALPGTSTEVLAAIECLKRERDEARRELAAVRECVASCVVVIGPPLQFSAHGEFDDLNKDGDT